MFEKISTPDCEKVFAAVSEYSGKAGNFMESVFLWAVAGIRLTLRVVGPFSGHAIRGVVAGLADLFIATGGFLKDLIGGSDLGNGSGHSTGVLDAGFGNWGKRRQSA